MKEWMYFEAPVYSEENKFMEKQFSSYHREFSSQIPAQPKIEIYLEVSSLTIGLPQQPQTFDLQSLFKHWNHLRLHTPASFEESLVGLFSEIHSSMRATHLFLSSKN